jgi:stage III sporulation protein AF
MDFLKEWITNIILFVLLATVVDMLLPNSNMQKYTRMVTGLLLIAIILSPVLKILSSDFEASLASITELDSKDEKNIENSIEMKKKEIQASFDAYALEEVAVQLKKDVEEELMEQYDLEIASIDLSVDETSSAAFPDNLQEISVTLRESTTRDVVEVVQMVDIDTNSPPPSHAEVEQSDELSSLLSEKWDVNKDAVDIFIEGGNE